MKPTFSSLIKISVFLLLGVAFGGGLVVYSESRGGVKKNNADEEIYSPSSSDESNRKYEKQFSVSEGGKIYVEADEGTVEIKSWDKKEVSIVVDIDGSDSRAGKYSVDFKQDGNTVSVIGKLRDKSFFHWHMGNLNVRYTIMTPRKFSAEVKTSGGDVEIAKLEGQIDLSTSGGNMRMDDITGDVSSSTSGGDIEANNINGRLQVETSGGNIRSTVVTGNFEGHTSGGDVVVEQVNGRVRASTSGGNIRLKVNGDNQGIDVETSGGDIDIYVKENIAATIDAQTTGGSVDCDLPIAVRGKVKESELHGKINGGGNPIKAETSGGSIRITALK